MIQIITREHQGSLGRNNYWQLITEFKGERIIVNNHVNPNAIVELSTSLLGLLAKAGCLACLKVEKLR